MPKKEVPITYRKSFIAKYILSDDRVKKVYEILKNKLMSINGMKSRISWFYDAFNVGRINFAKLSVRGKYVSLYLNLDPNKYPLNIYHQEDVSDRRRYKDTKFKMHVKSDRTLKYAFRLIDEEIELFKLTTSKIPNENYYLNVESESELVKRGLIQIEDKYEPKEEKYTYDPTEFVEVDNYYKDDKKEDYKYKKVPIFVDGSKVFVKERRSFEAKLIQSSSKVQEYYSVLKNTLLSYIKVKSRISWKYDAYSIGKIKLAKMQIRGKYLVLYLNLMPEKYNLRKLKLENVSNYSLFKETPLMLRIKNDERLEIGIELIKDLKKRFLLDEGFIKEKQIYSYEYQTKESLKEKGLIKTYAKYGDYSSKFEADLVAEIQSKKKNNFQVYKEEKRYVLSIDDNNNFVESYETVKIPVDGERDIVYLDVVNKLFEDDEVVSVKSLKEKGLLKEDVKFYKLIYRGGVYNKSLHFILQSISPIAEKILKESKSTFEILVEE